MPRSLGSMSGPGYRHSRARRCLVVVLALLASLVPGLGGAGAVALAAAPADMALLYASGPPYPVFTNQPVTFLVSFVDLGPGRATEVELTTQLPTGARFEPAQSDSACSETGGAVSCRFPAADVNGVFLVRITVNPATAGILQLTFTVTASEPDPDRSNNTQTETVEVVEPVEADVSVNLPSLAQAYAGQPFFFSVEIRNGGPATATGIMVTLELPPGLVPANPAGCTTTGAGLTCSYSFQDIPPLRGIVALIPMTALAAGSYTVLGRVAADQPDPVGSNNSDAGTVEVRPAADVSVQVAESADPATPGQALTYLVTVSNEGPSAASAVTLVDSWTTTVRGGVDLLSFEASQGRCSGAVAGKIDCELGDLASGARAVLTVTVRPRGTGSVTDEARASAVESDPSIANNVDSETTAVGPGT